MGKINNTKKSHKILLTSTNSGAGKTTVTCGILKALKNLNFNVSSFKCGPDYIDPLFHKHILGKKSVNLDKFFMNEDLLKYTFDKNFNNSDIAVIEGVMGFYDGIAGTTTIASAYDVANTLDCNCVLIVDAKGASYSIIATILGFISLTENSHIKAVILNKCSKHLFDLLAPLIQEKCNVIPLGFLPYDPDFAFESRHLGLDLGLISSNQLENLNCKIDKIANSVKDNINLDLLLKISENNTNLIYKKPELSQDKKLFNIEGKNKNIYIALDNAFCFYYDETFDLFEKLGFNLNFFSPLSDSNLTNDCDILYIGGGYPEFYLEQLSENISMKNSIKEAICTKKIPTLAECGGFMYLGKSIDNINMTNVIEADFYNTKKLSRFGYIDISCNNNMDNILLKSNETIKAHEFHYYDSDNNGDCFIATKPITNRSWKASHINENLVAGFPHLYLPSYFYS